VRPENVSQFKGRGFLSFRPEAAFAAAHKTAIGQGEPKLFKKTNFISKNNEISHYDTLLKQVPQ
jgi:hypothetical protein